ncbi:TIGR00299 family protein [Desulfonema ishimotonii]|uniref:Putative nickel insertion protein n=1 Tax=Desulfonema ishimotonii TaxID=45657 RepID=A0A401FWD5_9BACT|nr:nickel pincer cofactor biosynthesis protein LarC [Desulfonema ishimotonii]GBC61259.1 TIGR00299 family protein [Desulfonema ishimotonii]
MKALIFEPFSGAAGDMILGSLIGLGADREKVCHAIESAVDVSVSVDKADKRGIAAVDVHIRVPRETHSRHYNELVEIIRNAGLPDDVEQSALGVFAIMGAAESAVHGQPPETLHFHEVGQNDALADVIGSCTAIHDIGADAVFCTPVNVGGGKVKAAHGLMPVPAPATLEILRTGGLPFYGSGNRELLTPTGAALLTWFAKPVGHLPTGRVLATGYGAGDAETESPNVLRTLLMETGQLLSKDTIEVLESNVDDVTGEVLGNLFDRLLDLGARDVAMMPAVMKKGRPGHIIRVITLPEHSARLAREIMKETGTLGIRVIPTRHRFTADRRMDRVEIAPGGKTAGIAVKIAQDKSGEILHISAEYEDCRRIAEATGVPLRQIIRQAEEEAWRKFR